jgi:hypothetical protein
MSWATVKWGDRTVEFRAPKEGGRSRHVPVLFQWVWDGLLELYERRPHGSLAVCLNSRGWPFANQQSSTQCFGDEMRARGLPDDYRLKAIQKAHIEQLQALQVPDIKIAKLTGHTLATYETHYAKEPEYKRLDLADFAEFGDLSENGRYWLGRWGVPIPAQASSETPASSSLPASPLPRSG